MGSTTQWNIKIPATQWHVSGVRLKSNLGPGYCLTLSGTSMLLTGVTQTKWKPLGGDLGKYNKRFFEHLNQIQFNGGTQSSNFPDSFGLPWPVDLEARRNFGNVSKYFSNITLMRLMRFKMLRSWNGNRNRLRVFSAGFEPEMLWLLKRPSNYNRTLWNGPDKASKGEFPSYKEDNVQEVKMR